MTMTSPLHGRETYRHSAAGLATAVTRYGPPPLVTTPPLDAPAEIRPSPPRRRDARSERSPGAPPAQVPTPMPRRKRKSGARSNRRLQIVQARCATDDHGDTRTPSERERPLRAARRTAPRSPVPLTNETS